MITKFKKIYQFSTVGFFEAEKVPTIPEVDFANFRFAKYFLGQTAMFFGEKDIPHLPEFAVVVEPDGWVTLWYLHNTTKPIITTLLLLKEPRQLEGWWDAEVEKLGQTEDSYGCAVDSAYHVKVVAGRDSDVVVDIVISYPGVNADPIFIKD